ncbi:MAG: acetyl/propionyl-CoA carboxylase subunit alpha [Frankiaceae bacterium]|nr:acetyl/propionyl-CoA carboxylase subunit alpha [Frankiaceae bacterium]
MFETVLIANRGEIAVRITRTLRRLGIRAGAVYSDADAGARHVREADVAVRLGPAAARESYLSVERLLEAAARTGAQAVPPGYGFLAENTAFARACADAGLVFVGPPASAVEVMGDKIRAKQTVSAAGVPVVPGRTDLGMTDADLAEAADEVGYPVLVKPSAGGGGKGMRLVHEKLLLADALVSARREAASSFGDDTLFLERFVLTPRHIEVQVLADAHGTTVHLGERECSLQRRHQKVVEEAPSVLLDAAQRARYGELAVATARAVGYTGAGTVEFIVPGDAPDEPFFMEMNTRLQVEHPVTELVTGLDLVEQQLRVAAGERLAFGQAGVRLTGHAVEVRVYAEDPARGFLPTGGPALLVREPAEDGVRVDSSLFEGAAVGTTYDPMLSKVVAWGPDRSTALASLDRALAANVVLGVGTNTAFLRRLLQHPDVRAGRLDTGLIERELDGLVSGDVPVEVHAAFGLHRLLALETGSPDPWAMTGGWRLSGAAATSWTVAGLDGARLHVAVTGTPSAARVGVGDREVAASAERLPDGLLLTVDGSTRRVLTATDGATTWLHLDGTAHAVVELAPERRGAGAGSHDGDVRSPMPGAVIAVRASVGDEVTTGDVLLVVEAMKMEHALIAPVDGAVSELSVRVGDQVAVDQLLAVVTPAGPADATR